MSIGTIRYFDYGVESENIIGLSSNIGWEPDNNIPFITYSISIGFNF